MNKKIVFRVDGNSNIGSGHVVRCLNLARYIASCQNDVCIHFLIRPQSQKLIDLISTEFNVLLLPADEGWVPSEDDPENCIRLLLENNIQHIDLLVVDHYGLDKSWEKRMHHHLELLEIDQMLVIDDLADRPHLDGCWILDQTCYQSMINPYQDLLIVGAKFLLGAKYAIINPVFADYRPTSESDLWEKKYKGVVEGDLKPNLLISFGGADNSGETLKVIQNLLQLGSESYGVITALVGGLCPHLEKIRQEIKGKPKFQLKSNLSLAEVAEVLSKQHYCIGSSGTSTYERCYLGVPSGVIVVANNQIPNALNFEKVGAVKFLGISDCLEGKQEGIGESNLDLNKFSKWSGSALLREVPDNLWEMALEGYRLVDGQGLNRIYQTIINP